MKLIAIVVIIGTAVAGEAQYECSKGENILKVIHNCAVAYGATKAEFVDIINFKWASSKRMKYIRTCAFHGCQVFTDDGRFKPIISTITTTVLWGGNPYRARVIQQAANNCGHTLPKRLRNTYDTAEWFVRCLKLNSPVQLSLG